MTRGLHRSLLLLAGLLASACNDDNDLDSYLKLDAGSAFGGEQASDAGAGDAGALGLPPLPPGCAPFGEELPKTLSCTGLYGELGTGPAEKLVDAHNRGFTPGVALWTDGAAKQRWIAMPPNTQVDSSDANGWVFPEGTRVWKEFAFDGKRVETRLMYKRDGVWNFATYHWNDAQTEASFVDGAEVPLANGHVHSIPKIMQCNECHRGSRDKLLGFQQVLLGLPGAQGLTLTKLAAEGTLSNPPAVTQHDIPDDGTGVAAKALSYLHVNCGVSCHNETGNAQANMSRMFLRIDPATLDAPTPAGWNVVKLTVGVPSMTANFSGGTRILPGAPEDSVLIKLAETRGSNTAMPPIGTNVVDDQGLAAVKEWIARLGGHTTAVDAGAAIDGAVAAPDASLPNSLDAGAPEAPDAEAPTQDATVDAVDLDAGTPGAETLDAEVVDMTAPIATDPDAAAPVAP